jgi:hypothetical protein
MNLGGSRRHVVLERYVARNFLVGFFGATTFIPVTLIGAGDKAAVVAKP